MPPKATVNQKTFSEKAVVALVAQIFKAGGTSIDYKLLSGYDAANGGSTTASGFEHQFRALVKEARELNKELSDNSDAYPPVTSLPKGGGASTPKGNGASTPKSNGGPGGAGRKRGAAAADSDDSDMAAPTPSKKKKAAAPKKTNGAANKDFKKEDKSDGEGGYDMMQFINFDQDQEL